MSVFQQNASVLSGRAAAQVSVPVLQELSAVSDSRLPLSARLTGCCRRLRRSLTQWDACDMTPDRALACQEALARAVAPFDSDDLDARRQALQACIPILYNIRVPSARAQYLRRLAYLAPAYEERPEQFMLLLLPHIDAYGRGLPARSIVQTAGL